jgi:hypothetical protein
MDGAGEADVSAFRNSTKIWGRGGGWSSSSSPSQVEFSVVSFQQHIPRLTETQDRPVITQKFIIRKLKPKDPRRKVCHLVAHPANPDAATKPLDYSGMASFDPGTTGF